MGITGLIPFLEKASRKANVDEFSGCTVAIDSYCWLHKGAFACADKLVRGEETDIHIKYCLKYVSMLLARNIKPILVFDGRHLPAKAMTEAKRRESRNTSKKRAAELLSLGQIDEARSFMRRSVDITHEMALSLIKACRKRNVDCIVAPYEADSQLAYLNIKNIAQLVITEDSDLILFGCTKVLFKMDLDGSGTLVETVKLPLAMRCPIERYSFDKFRQMCIMSGCDYLSSLPGIGLAKARQFVNATQDSNFANALKKLSSFFNKSALVVTDEYRESFLKAEATFKHQYVYDPIERSMVRLNETDDEDIEKALCVNAGELLEPKIAFELAVGNLDPFTLKVMDNWHPDHRNHVGYVKTNSFREKGVSSHPSIWSSDFKQYLSDPCPWMKKVKKVEPIIGVPKTRPKKKIVNLESKYVPETQDEGLSIESLSSMYCIEPSSKRHKTDTNLHNKHDQGMLDKDISDDLTQYKEKSPILENKERSYTKCLRNFGLLKKLSKFPRTTMGSNLVESKFFSNNEDVKEELEHVKEELEDVKEELKDVTEVLTENKINDVTQIIDIDSQADSAIELSNSQKENSFSPKKGSPVFRKSPASKNPFKLKSSNSLNDPDVLSEDSVIDCTYSSEISQVSVSVKVSNGIQSNGWKSKVSPTSSTLPSSQPNKPSYKSSCRVPGLRKTASMPNSQTLLSKFGFQKKPAMKK